MLLAVIPTDGGILIETVFYADEIKELPKEYSYPEVNEAELAMAKTLINSMNQEFQPELYKDEYQERLKALIEQKIAGKEIVSAKQEEQSNVIDLMEALKASIEQTSTNPNAAAGAKSERRFLMNILGNKSLKPMLIGADSEPFDDPSYLFELKLDSERCLSYLNKDSTELRNMRLLPKFPELSQLHRQVKKNCILDGELAVIKDGKPNFSRFSAEACCLINSKHGWPFPVLRPVLPLSIFYI